MCYIARIRISCQHFSHANRLLQIPVVRPFTRLGSVSGRGSVIGLECLMPKRKEGIAGGTLDVGMGDILGSPFKGSTRSGFASLRPSASNRRVMHGAYIGLDYGLWSLLCYTCRRIVQE